MSLSEEQIKEIAEEMLRLKNGAKEGENVDIDNELGIYFVSSLSEISEEEEVEGNDRLSSKLEDDALSNSSELEYDDDFEREDYEDFVDKESDINSQIEEDPEDLGKNPVDGESPTTERERILNFREMMIYLKK